MDNQHLQQQHLYQEQYWILKMSLIAGHIFFCCNNETRTKLDPFADSLTIESLQHYTMQIVIMFYHHCGWSVYMQRSRDYDTLASTPAAMVA